MAQSPDGVELAGSRGARLDLTERLERLPHGHPSSPYEVDGSRKPPVVLPRASDGQADNGHAAADTREGATGSGDASDDTRAGSHDTHDGAAITRDGRATRDAETTTDAEPRQPELADAVPKPEPFTDTEWAEHVQEVSERLEQARADGLATNKQYTIEPDHEVWRADREEHHDALINDLYSQAASIPCDGRAIIAGGLPGAGKTTILENYAGIDRSQFLTINPDDIKVALARRGLVPDLPGLSPMEASDLVHEESSHLAKRLAFRAQADGKNLIWDITMSSLESTQGRIQDLRDNHYTEIGGIFVDLPPEVSSARAAKRHREAEASHLKGEGEGGRFISAESILANSDAAWDSVNRRTFEHVKASLDSWSIYDNSVDGREPVLLDSSFVSQQSVEEKIHDRRS